ncbi:TonB-dependent siderophore receptor [Rhodopseudomonas palustris]|uniref:TonB-dependent siderophore receptor n=1 Tax=Rhodopseudomonas palustris TaxID=1076 RepID=UPI0021F2939A|nr:TonB-dependent siderophore receptor [Rhodopseudomonas palustris]UYO42399.1 TonB-dependent siderophore receptor [Rhodopseudomonas palustris]
MSVGSDRSGTRTARRNYLAACATGALLISGAGLDASHAQQSRSSNPDLPPVVVQQDGNVRRSPAAREARSAASRRSPRVARTTAASPPPAPARQTDPGISVPGLNGYIAIATSVGSKTNTPVLALPRSTSTVTAQEIFDRDAASVQEALQYTAGVGGFFRQGNLTREYNRVRGFEAFQYLDGLKLHDSNWGFERYGLERVDVLKGPASTLYGQGSPGGIIDLTSKRPTETPFGEALLRMGLRGYLEGAFDVSGPANENKSVLYRFVGVGKMGDGEIDFTKNERVFFAPSVTIRPNEDTSLTLLASYQYDPHLTVLQPLPYVGTVVPGANGQFISRKTFLGEPNYHDTSKESYRIGYEFKHQFNDVFSFQQHFAYQNIDISLREVQSRSTGNVSTQRQMAYQQYNIDIFQIDNRLKADFETGPLRHHVMFGVDYASIPNYQGTGTNRGTSNFLLNYYTPLYGAALPNNPLTTKRYQDVEQIGVYLQDRIELGRLSVLFGARNDTAHFAQQSQTLVPATGNFTQPPWTRQNDNATTYQAGAIYAFDSGVAPYVNYSQSFAPTIGTDFSGRPFIPVTGDQIEGGMKYLPPGMNLSLSAAGFNITQKNVLTADLLNPGYAVQTSSVEASGAEIEVKTTRLYGFNSSAAYTYLAPKVTATNTAGGIGKDPVSMPRHAASLWTTYSFDDTNVLAGLTVGGGVRYVGSSFADTLNTTEIPSFTLVDLSLRYRLGAISASLQNWDVALNVKNLADKRYVGSCDAVSQCYYGLGRTVDGTIRVRF